MTSTRSKNKRARPRQRPAVTIHAGSQAMASPHSPVSSSVPMPTSSSPPVICTAWAWRRSQPVARSVQPAPTASPMNGSPARGRRPVPGRTRARWSARPGYRRRGRSPGQGWAQTRGPTEAEHRTEQRRAGEPTAWGDPDPSLALQGGYPAKKGQPHHDRDAAADALQERLVRASRSDSPSALVASAANTVMNRPRTA